MTKSEKKPAKDTGVKPAHKAMAAGKNALEAQRAVAGSKSKG